MRPFLSDGHEWRWLSDSRMWRCCSCGSDAFKDAADGLMYQLGQRGNASPVGTCEEETARAVLGS